MLFQPTNLIPSSFAGFGGDVIDASIENEFSLQLNGNSDVIAYNLTIMLNDTGSTVKYTTGKLTLTTPVYPTNYKGEQQYLVVNVPAGATSTLANGNEYKWKIQLWWGSTDVDSITSTESYFKTNASPTVVINNTDIELTTKNITLIATYTQTDNVTVEWFKWTLAILDGTDRNEIVVETNQTYSTDIRLLYSALEDGNTYSAKVTVMNNNGVETTSAWYDFDVTYSKPSVSGYLNASMTDSNGVLLEWSDLKFIEGAVSTGTAAYLVNAPITDRYSIDVQTGQNVVFDGTGDTSFELPLSVSHVWNGKLPSTFNGTFYKASGTDLGGNSYSFEIKYNSTSKNFELYINDVLISYSYAPVILNKWFNVQANSSAVDANLIKTDTYEGSFTIENLISDANFIFNGQTTNTSYIDKDNIDNILKVNGVFSVNVFYTNAVTHAVKLINNYFTSLVFSSANVGKNKIKDLDLKGLTNLSILNGGTNLYGTLDITGLVNLTKLDIPNTVKVTPDGLTTLTMGATTYPLLTELYANENPLGNIDFTKFTGLTKAKITNTNCSVLSLASCPNLAELELHNSDSLTLNPILSNQTNMVSLANSLPDRISTTKGILNSYPSNRDWIKSICDTKNWETYAVGTFTTSNQIIEGFYYACSNICYIEWGDGTVDKLQPTTGSYVGHTYSSAGTRTVKLINKYFTKFGSSSSSAPYANFSINNPNLSELIELTYIYGHFRYPYFNGILNITGLTKLQGISVDFCDITSLVMGSTIYPNFTQFDVDHNPIGNIDYSHFPNLSGSLLISSTNCSALDVSPCPNVSYIRLYDGYTSYAPNPILSNQTNMVAFANSLPDRTSKTSGRIEMTTSTYDTAWNWISAICATKNWTRVA